MTKTKNAVDRTFLVSGDADTPIVLAIYTKLREAAVLVQSDNVARALKGRARLMEAARIIAQAKIRPLKITSRAVAKDTAVREALADRTTFPGNNGTKRDAAIAAALTRKLGLKISPSLVRSKRDSQGRGRPRKAIDRAASD